MIHGHCTCTIGIAYYNLHNYALHEITYQSIYLSNDTVLNECHTSLFYEMYFFFYKVFNCVKTSYPVELTHFL